MNQKNLQMDDIKSVEELMRDVFRENKRRQFYWETLTEEVLLRIWSGDFPKGVKKSMEKTIQQLFPKVRREMEEQKEGVFCPTFQDNKKWKITAQTLADLEEDQQDVINELLRRERRKAAYDKAFERGKEAAVEQGILDTVTIEKQLGEASPE